MPSRSRPPCRTGGLRHAGRRSVGSGCHDSGPEPWKKAFAASGVPMAPASMSARQVWSPAPRNVSGAHPRRKLRCLARSTSAAPRPRRTPVASRSTRASRRAGRSRHRFVRCRDGEVEHHVHVGMCDQLVRGQDERHPGLGRQCLRPSPVDVRAGDELEVREGAQLGRVGTADVAAADDADAPTQRVGHGADTAAHARPRECPWPTSQRWPASTAPNMSVAQLSSSTMCQATWVPAAIAPATSTLPMPSATWGASRSAASAGPSLRWSRRTRGPIRLTSAAGNPRHPRSPSRCRPRRRGPGPRGRAASRGRSDHPPGHAARTRGCDSRARCRVPRPAPAPVPARPQGRRWPWRSRTAPARPRAPPRCPRPGPPPRPGPARPPDLEASAGGRPRPRAPGRRTNGARRPVGDHGATRTPPRRSLPVRPAQGRPACRWRQLRAASRAGPRPGWGASSRSHDAIARGPAEPRIHGSRRRSRSAASALHATKRRTFAVYGQKGIIRSEEGGPGMTSTGRPGAAVIGSGFIGTVHVEALRRLGVTVHGILGSSPERASRRAGTAGGSQRHTRAYELLADPAVDVVHVTSPQPPAPSAGPGDHRRPGATWSARSRSR